MKQDILEGRQRVVCADGQALVVRTFEPADRNERLLLIATATAVRCRFYFDYARFLAGHGFTVVTFDWRGVGDNRPDRLKGYRASMTDWARKDLPAVIDWASGRYGSPIIGVGHSFGGQAFGLADRAERFEKLLLIASGSGYVGHWPVPDRYVFSAALAVLKAATQLCGYAPGRRLGLGEDLPRNVALQWIGWCRSPDYLGDYAGHRAISAPVHSLGFSDDRYAPVRARRWLLDRYAAANRRLETLAPGPLGLRQLGHFDYFRRQLAESLWSRTLPWLLQRRV